MTHSIALQFEDDVTHFIACTEDETVADAAYRHGISIPLDCRDGACGTCKSFCEQGRYDGGNYIEDALTDDEARQGFVLPCRMRAKTDCVIRVPASSTACKLRRSTLRGRLAAVDRASDTTLTFSIAVDPSIKIDFLPGQYARIQVPGTSESRAYSFSSSPGNHNASFLIRDVPNGKMSTYLRQFARVGEPVTFDGPYGAFYLRKIERPLLMLAGGTGLAPFLSMLNSMVAEELLHGDGDQRVKHHSIRLIYGVTRDDDLVGLEQLDRLTEQLPQFGYVTCVADSGSAHPLKGYVTQHITSENLHEGDVDIYVCGPPPMVGAVRNWLSEKGVKPENFFFEKFARATAMS